MVSDFTGAVRYITLQLLLLHPLNKMGFWAGPRRGCRSSAPRAQASQPARETPTCRTHTCARHAEGSRGQVTRKSRAEESRGRVTRTCHAEKSRGRVTRKSSATPSFYISQLRRKRLTKRQPNTPSIFVPCLAGPATKYTLSTFSDDYFLKKTRLDSLCVHKEN